MKVFKFYSGKYYYGFSGESENEAKEALFKEYGSTKINNVEEIPESKWYEKIVNIWEDNDFEREPYKVSINEIISKVKPQLIFTNDTSIF